MIFPCNFCSLRSRWDFSELQFTMQPNIKGKIFEFFSPLQGSWCAPNGRLKTDLICNLAQITLAISYWQNWSLRCLLSQHLLDPMQGEYLETRTCLSSNQSGEENVILWCRTAAAAANFRARCKLGKLPHFQCIFELWRFKTEMMSDVRHVTSSLVEQEDLFTLSLLLFLSGKNWFFHNFIEDQKMQTRVWKWPKSF